MTTGQQGERQVSDEDARPIAAALRKRWGPCESYECDDEDGMCHIPMIREVLAEAVAQRFPPLSVDSDVVDVAWHMICAYADLPPADLAGLEQRMLVSRTHLASALTRAMPQPDPSLAPLVTDEDATDALRALSGGTWAVGGEAHRRMRAALEAYGARLLGRQR